MSEKTCDMGLVGLGVMGRNLVLNIADHKYSVAGYDLDPEKTRSLQKEKKSHHAVETATDMGAFLNLLRSPRAVIGNGRFRRRKGSPQRPQHDARRSAGSLRTCALDP